LPRILNRMDVTKETVDQLAKLSRLNLEESEKESLTDDLNRILHFVDQLKEVETDGVEPLIFLNENDVVRDDKAEATMSRDEALKNALSKDEQFFLVPKVIK
jgi:aspartyl-tRNA(Asn)/glutamyl-tRNA(Gln) amidotransferase subunit C